MEEDRMKSLDIDGTWRSIVTGEWEQLTGTVLSNGQAKIEKLTRSDSQNQQKNNIKK